MQEQKVYPGLIDAYVEFPTAADTSPRLHGMQQSNRIVELRKQLKADAAKLQRFARAGIAVVLAASRQWNLLKVRVA